RCSCALRRARLIRQCVTLGLRSMYACTCACIKCLLRCQASHRIGRLQSSLNVLIDRLLPRRQRRIAVLLEVLIRRTTRCRRSQRIRRRVALPVLIKLRCALCADRCAGKVLLLELANGHRQLRGCLRIGHTCGRDTERLLIGERSSIEDALSARGWAFVNDSGHLLLSLLSLPTLACAAIWVFASPMGQVFFVGGKVTNLACI